MTETPIANLLDSLDLNKRFKTSAYFTICFSSLPSSLHLVLSSEKKQDAVGAILAEMELEKFNFDIVFKNWSTEDFQNSQSSDDYVFEYVFKSEGGRMLIHFTARDFSYITVEFLYDHTLKNSEDWVLSMNHKLRSKFGAPKNRNSKYLCTKMACLVWKRLAPMISNP